LNEAIMPLKVVGFSLRGLLHILPLGITMFFKGKIPNPFGHALPGIGLLHALIRRVRRAMPPA
jgi:succinate dehydrogenase / fumarate reductase iron-sulfur subunit